MKRLALIPLLVIGALLAGCGAEQSEETSVLLTLVRPETGEQQRLVSCPGWQACPELLALSDQDLEPVPEGQPCTMIYGGDLEAYISGTFRGREVNASYSLNNGCEIERWERVAPVFDVVFGSGPSSEN